MSVILGDDDNDEPSNMNVAWMYVIVAIAVGMVLISAC